MTKIQKLALGLQTWILPETSVQARLSLCWSPMWQVPLSHIFANIHSFGYIYIWPETAFPTRLHVRPAKGSGCTGWSEWSLSARRRCGCLPTHRVPCKDSDQTLIRLREWYAPSRKHAYIILILLNPVFYVVKLGFIGVNIICLISARKHRLWVLVRTASARWF